MKVLLVGGTGFMGAPTARRLVEAGHEVAVFHRGKREVELPPEVVSILGDRHQWGESAEALHRFAPEVVVDYIAFRRETAEGLLEAFRGIAQRVVLLSSADVYRNYEGLHGKPTAPPDPAPLSEDAPLREGRFPYRERASGPDDLLYHYDKIPVEEAFLSDPNLAGTVLRLPMVHGPGDRQHRLYPYAKRMQDGRPAILLETGLDEWTAPRSYVENVAAAIALTATDPRAAGRVYNVADPPTLTELEWVRRIAEACAWTGDLVLVPESRLPKPLRSPTDWSYPLATDSTRLREELGFIEPVSLEEGIRRTVEWELAHPPANLKPEQFDYAAEDQVLAAERGG